MLALVYPPEGSPLMAPPESKDGSLVVVEAWPGSVVLEPENAELHTGVVSG